MAAAKESPKKGKSLKRWAMYEKSGNSLTRKNKSCPKCGPGTFMAKHKDRTTCGSCHYTEFSKK